MATVRDIVTALDGRFPPHLAEEWDAVGLVAGDPAATVTRVHFAVDPTVAVIDEALLAGADMLVAHHPLMMRGVTSVAADTPKGAAIQRLIAGGCALFTAHTNADAAAGGVADALAAALGLRGTKPLVPQLSDPAVGTGRIGALERTITLRAFAERVAATLPATHHGVRVAGDLDAKIATVAVVAGSGDKYLDAACASGADVYVTADLRHHPAADARALAELGEGTPHLVDVSHFASEWAWLEGTAAWLANECGVATHVSTLNTDPWTARIGAPPVA